ncbi:MAG: epoxyqueuosine reductase QueH [Bacteroidales bacterium]|jgi:predicted adenine nucleotide alpha hydrolase (AANH) superfamily ATPase|nr:epoxyqueuosine reductase QueH [Bacteroidales bacterium]
MNTNYQKILDETLEEIAELRSKPSLLLHSCCGPCSSYVLEYLSKYFCITIFYYNPNIFPKEEYRKRLNEQRRLIDLLNEDKINKVNKKESLLTHTDLIKIIEGDYYPDVFDELVKGMEDMPEGGDRCTKCYELRLQEAAIIAKKLNFDYFTTTLSVSPMKNADKLNKIGGELAEKYGLKYLLSDFKKKEGYKRSIELSKIYGIYRQEYCGCIYSKSITCILK